MLDRGGLRRRRPGRRRGAGDRAGRGAPSRPGDPRREDAACSTASPPRRRSPSKRIAPVVILTAFSPARAGRAGPRRRRDGLPRQAVHPDRPGARDRDGGQPLRRAPEAGGRGRRPAATASRPARRSSAPRACCSSSSSSASPTRSGGSRRRPWTCASRCARWPRASSSTARRLRAARPLPNRRETRLRSQVHNDRSFNTVPGPLAPGRPMLGSARNQLVVVRRAGEDLSTTLHGGSMIRMNRSWRIAAAATAGLALAPAAATTEDRRRQRHGGEDCNERQEPRLPRRDDRRRRCPRPQHGRRHPARARRVQQERRLQGRAQGVRLAGQTRRRLRRSRPRSSTTTSIIGLIGPGFSGESLATGKTFFEAGLPSISPSATNVTITEQGWTTWHRVIGNDARAGRGRREVPHRHRRRQEGLRRRRRPGLQRGPGQRRQGAPGRRDGRLRPDPGRPDRHVGVVTKVKSSGADAVFYGGYYTEAGLLAKQLRQARLQGHVHVG